MQLTTKIAVISAVLFIILGYSNAYNMTGGILGSVVGQSGAAYGTGNTVSNYGFLIHGVVFGVAMMFILKHQMRG